MDKIAAFLHTVKDYSKYLIIPSGVIMFAPDEYLTQWGLIGIKHSFSLLNSIIFLFSMSVIIVDFSAYLLRVFKNILKDNKINKTRIGLLKQLNPHERLILLKMLRNDSADVLQLNNAHVVKLENWGIIGRSTISLGGLHFSYFIQPWAEIWLKDNPNYFERTE
jgi:hypothetical protein